MFGIVFQMLSSFYLFFEETGINDVLHKRMEIQTQFIKGRNEIEVLRAHFVDISYKYILGGVFYGGLTDSGH